MRGLRTIPVLLDMCRRHGGALPGRHRSSTTSNPMAMNCWAISRASDDQDGRPVPQRAGHGAASWRATSACPIDEINYLCAGINHMAFYLALRARRRGSLPADPRGARRGPRARRQPGALRDAEAPRLLRHRVERALRRVRALVHQARPARPDRASSTSRSTSTRAAARSRSRVGTPMRDGATSGGDADRGAAAATSTRRTIIRSIETGKPRVIYGNVAERRADRQPARRLHASRCRAWSTATACSRPRSARCRRSSPR